MLFDGKQLHDVLERSTRQIELHNEQGRCCRLLSPDEALKLNLDLFIGIGNRRRIRFLRPRTQQWTLNAGSQTTKRITDRAGVHIAHPQIREHRTYSEFESSEGRLTHTLTGGTRYSVWRG